MDVSILLIAFVLMVIVGGVVVPITNFVVYWVRVKLVAYRDPSSRRIHKSISNASLGLLCVGVLGITVLLCFFKVHLTSVFQHEYEVVVCQDTCVRFVTKEPE